MSKPKAHIVRAQTILAVGKRVLFVEGKDDLAVYAKWLEKLDPVYGNRLELVATNGRLELEVALASLGHLPDAYALRDRDEWDAARIAPVRSTAPGLLVNAERHCLENYFCDPDEVVAALLAKDAAKYSPSEAALRAALSPPLADWVDHWAMWTTAMQLQTDMVSEGYASIFHDTIPLPTEADIQHRLRSWANLADADVVWKSFLDLRNASRARSTEEKHRGCVHGKKYWDQVVMPALRAVEKRADWLIDLAEWSSVPPDLAPILRTVLT